VNQNRETIFSKPERTYRYVLWREWDKANPHYTLIIGLNPSTADEKTNDRTIIRCISFAKDEDCGALCVTNLFAFISPVPIVMKNHAAPIGPDNDKWLIKFANEAKIVIAAWGTHGNYLQRDLKVMGQLKKLWCLAKTKHGFPKHPLFIKKGMRPIPFNF
jgi:hypothetical protein